MSASPVVCFKWKRDGGEKKKERVRGKVTEIREKQQKREAVNEGEGERFCSSHITVNETLSVSVSIV